MSFIEISFSSSLSSSPTAPQTPGLHFNVHDVVAAAVAAGFPLKGAQGHFCILHGDRVGQLPTTQLASVALRELDGAEILMFVYEGFERCVACKLHYVDVTERVVVRLNLEGAPPEEQHEAARALTAIIDALPEVQLQAELAELAG